MTSLRMLAVVVLVLGPALASAAEERSYVRPSLARGDGPPFSGAVRVGSTLYLAGDIGLDENQKVPDTAKGEARLLLQRIKRTLADAGFTMDDLVYVTVYCSDVKHYADWNEVYRGYFEKEFPARAFIGSGRLLFDARFEMQGIAVKR